MSYQIKKKSKKTSQELPPKKREPYHSRSRFMNQSFRKVGLAPGTLIPLAEKQMERVKVTIIEYSDRHFKEWEAKDLAECVVSERKPGVTWINIDGIGDIGVMETIGKLFGMHPLVIEDITDTDQRPKMEWHENYIFIIAKMLYWDDLSSEIQNEQVCIVLGANYVISFQEKNEKDVFDPLRDRLRTDKGSIRKQGADYIAYSLLDAIVDNYFAILEVMGEKIEALEGELVASPEQALLQTIYSMKRELLVLRKACWPLRGVLTTMEKTDHPFIRHSTNIFLRDVYDHIIQVIETTEIYRDMLSGMFDIYLSSISYRTNEVMKVLAIIATVFMPLTFLAGLYGMNFKYMVELEWEWSYPILICTMVIIVILMMLSFKERKWL